MMGNDLNALVGTHLLNIRAPLIRRVNRSLQRWVLQVELTKLEYACWLEHSSFVTACASASLLRTRKVWVCAKAAIMGSTGSIIKRRLGTRKDCVWQCISCNDDGTNDAE
jgi:hypothetical protein